MCELIYVSKLEEVRLLSYILFYLDSLSNPDGAGFFCDNNIYKKGLPFSLIEDMAEKINELKGPLLGHVRLATNKLLKDCHAHPYENDLFILAHNGVLSLRVGEIPKNKVDSEFFAEKLRNYMVEKNDYNFPHAISEFMKEWYGGFAFLVYYKPENKYYAIRGNRPLYYSIINKSSLVINTSKEDLLLAINLANNISIITGEQRIIYDEIKELERESIFEIDNENLDFIKVGEIKENQREFPKFLWAMATDKPIQYKNDGILDKLTNYVINLDLSFSELNRICSIIFCKNIIELDRGEFEELLIILETMMEEVTEKKLELWKYGKSIPKIYLKIEFPWFLNSEEILEKIIKEVRNENRK